MNSIHFRRWSEQLKDSDHEVYWFDILDQGYAPSMSWMTQITGWKKGFLQKRGRTALKKFVPSLFTILSKNFDTKVDSAFAKALEQIKPDVVHSFALYISCAPILSVMNKNPTIKWIYSSWGSDLFYFQNEREYFKDIKQVLPRIDFLFTDCKRDYEIARKYGFKGEFLGVFPGGGGFDLTNYDQNSIPHEQRKKIIVKGYENRSGRALNVLRALEIIAPRLSRYEIVVFGADNRKVLDYQKSSIPNLTIYQKVDYNEIVKIFGQSVIYIGNSNSDGIPNTLLEAICARVFPIQSNPGGATEEVIKDKINGLLIKDPTNVEEIINCLNFVLNDLEFLKKAIDHNSQTIRPALSRDHIKSAVLNKYNTL